MFQSSGTCSTSLYDGGVGALGLVSGDEQSFNHLLSVVEVSLALFLDSDLMSVVPPFTEYHALSADSGRPFFGPII